MGFILSWLLSEWTLNFLPTMNKTFRRFMTAGRAAFTCQAMLAKLGINRWRNLASSTQFMQNSTLLPTHMKLNQDNCHYWVPCKLENDILESQTISILPFSWCWGESFVLSSGPLSIATSHSDIRRFAQLPSCPQLSPPRFSLFHWYSEASFKEAALEVPVDGNGHNHTLVLHFSRLLRLNGIVVHSQWEQRLICFYK